MCDLYDKFEERLKKPLKKTELIEILKELAADDDYEITHSLADAALIKYINDDEIAEAYYNVGKYYA